MGGVGRAPGHVGPLHRPSAGGTHLPDITVGSPVYRGGRGRRRARPDFYVAARAHHADVGGAYAGSMGPATEIYQEGLIIPPVKIADRDGFAGDVVSILLANVRTPRERRGDLAAQLACVRLGERRLREMGEAHGRAELLFGAGARIWILGPVFQVVTHNLTLFLKSM